MSMLIYSMGVSVDGIIADREGAFSWSVPNEDQFRFHTGSLRLFQKTFRLLDGDQPIRIAVENERRWKIRGHVINR